ncbi:MAG TPA: HD domain-containing protein [Opitutaceae bacterium]|nr:HD domain-containing protein [Opitutaceae bacterium]
MDAAGREGAEIDLHPPTSESPAQRLARQVEFIAECDKLKEIFRQTANTQSRRAENDAEHSWHLCLCVIVLAEHANSPTLDVLRVLKMVILHDLVEIDAGDTFGYDTAGQEKQHERECIAAERIFGLLPADQSQDFRALWDEFEAQQTAEAKFALAVDRFQPVLLNCRTEGGGWKKHGVTQDRVVARNSRIADGSVELWRTVEKMIQRTVDAGHLAKGPAPITPADIHDV